MKKHGTEYCGQCGELFGPGRLSNRGYCQACSRERIADACSQMVAKSGPLYERWRTNYLAAMSGVVERLAKECEGEFTT